MKAAKYDYTTARISVACLHLSATHAATITPPYTPVNYKATYINGAPMAQLKQQVRKAYVMHLINAAEFEFTPLTKRQFADLFMQVASN